jgi:hypothetical protein
MFVWFYMSRKFVFFRHIPGRELPLPRNEPPVFFETVSTIDHDWTHASTKSETRDFQSPNDRAVDRPTRATTCLPGTVGTRYYLSDAFLAHRASARDCDPHWPFGRVQGAVTTLLPLPTPLFFWCHSPLCKTPPIDRWTLMVCRIPRRVPRNERG